MFRLGWMLSGSCRTNGSGITSSCNILASLSRASTSPVSVTLPRSYSSLVTRSPSLVQNAAASRLLPGTFNLFPSCRSLLQPQPQPSTAVDQVRTLTKFSRQSGKRKSVKAVLKRFMRLDWGAWIHTKSGRHKKLWKKTSSQKRRLRQHVFCNSTQSFLLDKMVTSFWRRPKHYVNDPYRPYHSREEFPATQRRG